jgi:rubredoxin
MSETEEHFEWCCPNCGWDTEESLDRAEMISCSEERFVYAVAIEYGGNPVEWDETWKCPVCDTVFEFQNSNY